MLPMLLTLLTLPAHQHHFFSQLLPLWQAIPGRVNARNLSRYVGWNERTVPALVPEDLAVGRGALGPAATPRSHGGVGWPLHLGAGCHLHSQIGQEDGGDGDVLERCDAPFRNRSGAVLPGIAELVGASRFPCPRVANSATLRQSGPSGAISGSTQDLVCSRRGAGR